jgi:hypothetical protein
MYTTLFFKVGSTNKLPTALGNALQKEIIVPAMAGGKRCIPTHILSGRLHISLTSVPLWDIKVEDGVISFSLMFSALKPPLSLATMSSTVLQALSDIRAT